MSAATGLTVCALLAGFAVPAELGDEWLSAPPQVRTEDHGPGPLTSHEREVAALVAKHGCSYWGYGEDGPEPRRAVVTRAGRVELVDAAVGWRVRYGQEPGQLHAFCLS